mgnify:FL=1
MKRIPHGVLLGGETNVKQTGECKDGQMDLIDLLKRAMLMQPVQQIINMHSNVN